MMMSGTQYEQGEIVVVPFPFTDLSAVKQRPVLILSTTAYNSATEDIVVCGMTSNLKDAGYSVAITNRDLSYGEIPTDSRIKVDKIFTLKNSLVRKRVAKVNPAIFEKVKEQLMTLVGVSRELANGK